VIATMVGDYKETHCCLCDRPITQQDATPSGGGVQSMGYGCRAHKRCYEARYKEPTEQVPSEMLERQAWLDLFGEDGAQFATVTTGTVTTAMATTGPTNSPNYLAWQFADPKQDVAEAIGEAAERYFEKWELHPDAVLLNERDWKRSGLDIGSVVHGCAVRVSFMIPDPGVLKVGLE
jgi:hypothetical protein